MKVCSFSFNEAICCVSWFPDSDLNFWISCSFWSAISFKLAELVWCSSKLLANVIFSSFADCSWFTVVWWSASTLAREVYSSDILYSNFFLRAASIMFYWAFSLSIEDFNSCIWLWRLTFCSLVSLSWALLLSCSDFTAISASKAFMRASSLSLMRLARSYSNC